MDNHNPYTKLVSFINGDSSIRFDELCLDVFQYQAQFNPIYNTYINQLKMDVANIKSINQIPFLPIEFFKTHKVITQNEIGESAITFTSSGTTGETTSKHHVVSLNLYEQSFKKCFELFYGNIEDYCILALLPSYLEREGSSLIYMAERLIKDSKNTRSGFYLNNLSELNEVLVEQEVKNKKTLLLGVTYALLDFADFIKGELKLQNTIIMETGGMKGKRKELIREDVHHKLAQVFGVNQIHSEYGMTELLSQAYSKGSGMFACPPWMRVLIRDMNDPLTLSAQGKTGGINIIDLANLFSCSFIATQDMGKLHSGNMFEVLGRFDNSDVRGCNLLL